MTQNSESSITIFQLHQIISSPEEKNLQDSFRRLKKIRMASPNIT